MLFYYFCYSYLLVYCNSLLIILFALLLYNFIYIFLFVLDFPIKAIKIATHSLIRVPCPISNRGSMCSTRMVKILWLEENNTYAYLYLTAYVHENTKHEWILFWSMNLFCNSMQLYLNHVCQLNMSNRVWMTWYAIENMMWVSINLLNAQFENKTD